MHELPATFGKYYLTEKLATGGMAEIYLGKILGPAGFEKQLVIKQIHPRLTGQRRVEARERLAQALRKDNLSVVVAFGGRLIRGNFGAIADLPPGACEPGEGGFLNHGFGKSSHLAGRDRQTLK